MARKTSVILLSLLGVFLLGTVIVLSTTKSYLRIDDWAYIQEAELNSTSSGTVERIPRILHQTWKTDVLPERWREPSQHCRDLMPDYEYMLWTDEKARELIKDHYSWFLPTYDGYGFNIQRADAIRYFVLHRYGGVYLDLDIGCLHSIDPLLKYEVILPRTIPVGVSNDLMFAAKGHPFMEQVTRALITFDINYLLNYPTVMFSTGPMFMSVQYGLYTASHPPTPSNPGGEVRILPKSLYGKNAKPGEAPNSFFEHYYGSSWHGDDAWLWTFLGVWGVRLMYVACVFLVIAGVRLYWMKRKGHSPGLRRRLMFGRYEVVLPRFHYDRNSTQLDLGPYSIVAPHGSSSTHPTSSGPPSPTSELPRFPIIPIPFDLNPPSPTLSTISAASNDSRAMDAFKRAGTWVINVPQMFMTAGRSSSPATDVDVVDDRKKSRRRSARDIMFFLPAIFTQSSSPSSSTNESLPLPRRGSNSPLRHRVDVEDAGEEVSLLAASAVNDNVSTATSRTASRRNSLNVPRDGLQQFSHSPPPYPTRSRSPTPPSRYGS